MRQGRVEIHIVLGKEACAAIEQDQRVKDSARRVREQRHCVTSKAPHCHQWLVGARVTSDYIGFQESVNLAGPV